MNTDFPTLSVVIPVYNEESTLEELLAEVSKSEIVTELILIDDCSTDNSLKKIFECKDQLSCTKPEINILIEKNVKNMGKGAAIRKGFEKATSEVIIVQDADLEYDPKEYISLIQPIKDGKADVVYGSRFIGFGFYYDPNSEDRLVDGVIEGSPAAKVLKVGDKFVSVNGVQATKENWDNGKLTFGGAPGGKVEVEVLRNGKTIKRSFKRGMVNPKSTKDQVLDNMNDAVAEDWPAIDYKIIEVAGNPKEKVSV